MIKRYEVDFESLVAWRVCAVEGRDISGERIGEAIGFARSRKDAEAFAAALNALREDHAAEVEQLRARAVTIADESFGPFPALTADEALTEIEKGIFRGIAERRRLQAELERLRSDRDAQREAAIHGAVFAKVYLSRGYGSEVGAIEIANHAVEIWRAAQKGGAGG